MANIFPVPIKGTEFRHKVIAESHFLTIVTEGTCSDFQGGSGASEKEYPFQIFQRDSAIVSDAMLS